MSYFSRIITHTLFVFSISVLCCSAAVQANQPAAPLNLLIITADDMNADSGGWTGNSLRPTPNLDAFARSSHRFINSHVTVPICQPGRSALMTGRVPHRNGALGFNPIHRDVPTLVEVLRASGYYTGAIAKTAHMAPADKFPWDSMGEQAIGKQPAKFAASFREMLANAAQAKKPFFINANICDPHRPFIGAANGDNTEEKAPAQKAAQQSGKKAGKKAKAISDDSLNGVHVYKPDEIIVPSFLEDIPRVREEVAQYYTSVSRFDMAFGLLMQELKEAGRDKDTIVVFMSDHGMSFPFSKATVYVNGTSSPVLARVPGMAEPQEHPEFVSSVDIMPSVLELMQVKAPEGMDGRSWVPLLYGKTQENRDYVVTHVNTVSSGKSFPQRCIRTRDRALMFHGWVGGTDKFRVEAMSGLSFAAMNASSDPKIQSRVSQLLTGETLMLFDMQADPTERTNLIHEARYASEVQELGRKLLEHMQRTNDPQTAAFEAAMAQFKLTAARG